MASIISIGFRGVRLWERKGSHLVFQWLRARWGTAPRSENMIQSQGIGNLEKGESNEDFSSRAGRFNTLQHVDGEKCIGYYVERLFAFVRGIHGPKAIMCASEWTVKNCSRFQRDEHSGGGGETGNAWRIAVDGDRRTCPRMVSIAP
jgi:hypothetical protein